VSTGPWNDDEMEPLAPLPPHERGWRHPSELGDQTWRQTEPPIALGRGLAAATGMFAGLLALALLMTMLPTHAGRSAAASVRSTIGVLTSDDTGPLVDPGSSGTATTAPATETSDVTLMPNPRTEAMLRTMPTYQVYGGSGLAIAVVIATSAGHLVLTTADAVRANLTVELALSDGSTMVVPVLFVDQRSGLALLAPSAARALRSMVPFRVAPGIAPGDELTFFGDRSITLRIADDGSLSSAWEADSTIHDGSPVINQRGELVALCSYHNGLHHLIGVDSLAAIEQALAAYTADSPVWMGISVSTDDSGAVRIDALDPSGPAAAAGLAVGDRIVSVEGTSVSAIRDLSALLALFEPGDQLTVTVRGADSAGGAERPERTVVVTLGAPHSSI